jgi:hypothetical protein
MLTEPGEHCRRVLLSLGLLCAIGLARCGIDDREPGVRAAQFKVGQTRQELVHAVGEPSRVRPVDLTKNPLDACSQGPPSAFALEYDIPKSGIEARVRAKTGTLFGMTVVCIDKQGVIVSINKVTF